MSVVRVALAKMQHGRAEDWEAAKPVLPVRVADVHLEPATEIVRYAAVIRPRIEADLAWTIQKRRREAKDFPGAKRILREYERAVVFTLGRFTGVKGPGLIILIPLVQRMVKVDLRTVVLDVPTQDVISRDNVSVKVNAVIYFRVVEPDKAIIQVVNFMEATSQLAQTTLRSVLGKHELDEMLAERDRLNADIQEMVAAEATAHRLGVQFDSRQLVGAIEREGTE